MEEPKPNDSLHEPNIKGSIERNLKWENENCKKSASRKTMMRHARPIYRADVFSAENTEKKLKCPVEGCKKVKQWKRLASQAHEELPPQRRRSRRRRRKNKKVKSGIKKGRKVIVMKITLHAQFMAVGRNYKCGYQITVAQNTVGQLFTKHF